tara:strand:- start:294 stop:698 length:405 start_codon:yes stop_codon:yes gene_type:complete
MTTIGIQGGRGSFSEKAAYEFAKNHCLEDTELEYLITSEAVLDAITEIHPHQEALRQCRDYLSEHFWARPLVEADDTAETARRLNEGKLPKTAGVIANKECAALYEVEVLHESIHDLKHNLTLLLGIKTLDYDD